MCVKFKKKEINLCSTKLFYEIEQYLEFSDRYGEQDKVGRIKDDWKKEEKHCLSVTFLSHIEVSDRTDPVKAF